MKKTILLFVLFVSVALAQQDLISSLQNSFRLLDEAPNGPVVQCFDYQTSGQQFANTEKERRCPKNYAHVEQGQFRKVRKASDGYRGGNYLLSRPTANKYQAILNLNFVARTPTADDPATATSAQIEQMKQRTRNCLREMSPFMKGPNGEQFEVSFVTPDEPLPPHMERERPLAARIEVSERDETYRGDSMRFGTNFQCVTIGHEILHHLGLCDEYHEGVYKGPQGNVDWSCRAVTTEPSYMRNMRYAYDTTIPQTSRCVCDDKCQKIMSNPAARNIYLSMNANEILNTESSLMDANNTENPDRNRCQFKSWLTVAPGEVPHKAFKLANQTGNVYQYHSYGVRVNSAGDIYYEKSLWECNCPPGHPFCSRMMDQLRQREAEAPKRVKCPKDAPSKSEAPSIGADIQGSRMTDCTGEGAARVCELVVSSPGTGKSLIHPTQFNKILAGNCTGGSPAYEECEGYSYMGAGASCNQKPARCNSDDYLLRGILPAGSGQ